MCGVGCSDEEVEEKEEKEEKKEKVHDQMRCMEVRWVPAKRCSIDQDQGPHAPVCWTVQQYAGYALATQFLCCFLVARLTTSAKDQGMILIC